MVGKRVQTMDEAKRAVGTTPSYINKTKKRKAVSTQKRAYQGPARGVATDMRMPKKAGSRSTYGITEKSGGQAPTKLSAGKVKAKKAATKAAGRAKYEAKSAKRKATALWRKFNQ